MNHHSTYATIDLDAIRQNITALHQKTGAAVMAVIKADAYGHGAVPIAHALTDLCSFFGVACLAEAMELRRSGITTPILILGHTAPANFSMLVAHNIRPTLYSLADAEALSAEACRQKKTADFHIAVDTGMARIGFQPTEEAAAICLQMAALPGLRAEGIFSHYATADCRDLTAARAQTEKFETFLALLRTKGLEIPLPHMNNSAAAMNFSNHYAMVRSGIATYGVYPSDEVDPALLALTPVLRWCSEIVHIKTLPSGSPIGYGGTYVTQRETVVATLAVGYADGYCRSLSGNFYVLIRGKRAPILGRVCMDQLMVDVTDIPHTALGDRAVLLGSDGNETITAEAMANAAGVFHYELLTGIGRRVPRQYIQTDKPSFWVNYLQ